jgi:hypothetical protein
VGKECQTYGYQWISTYALTSNSVQFRRVIKSGLGKSLCQVELILNFERTISYIYTTMVASGTGKSYS